MADAKLAEPSDGSSKERDVDMAKLPNRSNWWIHEPTPIAQLIGDGGTPELGELAVSGYDYHDWLIAEVKGYLAQGVTGDAIGWAEFARDYRTIIAEYETRIAELEEIIAAAFRLDIGTVPQVSVAMLDLWEWEAKAAERRAANAEQRRALVLGDNDERHASDELWMGCPAESGH